MALQGTQQFDGPPPPSSQSLFPCGLSLLSRQLHWTFPFCSKSYSSGGTAPPTPRSAPVILHDAISGQLLFPAGSCPRLLLRPSTASQGPERAHGGPRPAEPISVRVTPGVTCPPPATRQAAPSGSPHAAPLIRPHGAPPGPSAMPAGCHSKNQGRARLTGFVVRVFNGVRTHQGPRPLPAAPTSSARQGDTDEVPDAHGPSDPHSRRPAAQLEAAARQTGPTWSSALLRSAAEARLRHGPVLGTAPALQGGPARGGLFFRIFTVGPSRATDSDVRHVQNLGHAPKL
ncbi:hypothetical protein NDU88_006423 [Pleurodeles waltl]|uniref:Uncharacterized protein n=1 Tax=Pleurodeles waltl TaxID=8319 RepID=A0AAV7RR64_PLEWA|nr:hypothetical protein NDU88_006423 [Pleurodeles waltl]